ncbi:DUF1737 domain-containing protein [Candidatus Saccharibacteria bacterium]|nr:DUF1737 domain-containing protein [Candidatus Saccharibacteria bacterium]
MCELLRDDFEGASLSGLADEVNAANDDDEELENEYEPSKPRYVVVECSSVVEFAREVNEKLEEGYRLFGSMKALGGASSSAAIVHIQALILDQQ